MLKYGKDPKFELDSRHPLNVDRQSLGLVPHNAVVLDIGCATGFMGEYLQKHKKCRVDGIELGSEEAKSARKVLRHVYEIDVEDEKSVSKIKTLYDVILASALLEHLKDPHKALLQWKRLLRKDGMIIATVPNVAHWNMRLHVLLEKFSCDYYEHSENL